MGVVSALTSVVRHRSAADLSSLQRGRQTLTTTLHAGNATIFSILSQISIHLSVNAFKKERKKLEEKFKVRVYMFHLYDSILDPG